MAIVRLLGIESNAPQHYAEAFYGRITVAKRSCCERFTASARAVRADYDGR